MTKLSRDKSDPWQLKAPPGSANYTMHVEMRDGVRVLVCSAGKTGSLLRARCIDDLHAVLKASGDWVD